MVTTDEGKKLPGVHWRMLRILWLSRVLETGAKDDPSELAWQKPCQQLTSFPASDSKALTCPRGPSGSQKPVLPSHVQVVLHGSSAPSPFRHPQVKCISTAPGEGGLYGDLILWLDKLTLFFC